MNAPMPKLRSPKPSKTSIAEIGYSNSRIIGDATAVAIPAIISAPPESVTAATDAITPISVAARGIMTRSVRKNQPTIFEMDTLLTAFVALSFASFNTGPGAGLFRKRRA